MKPYPLTTLGIWLMLSLPASGYQICVTPSGRIRAPHVDGACGERAERVDLATGTDLVEAQRAKVPPPAAVGDLRVIDTNGRAVGLVLSVSLGGTLAVRTIEGRAVALPLGPNGLVSLGLDYVYFSTPDCSGPPLVIDQATNLMTFPPVLAAQAFVQSGPGTQQITESFLSVMADCREAGGVSQRLGCCVPERSGGVLAPAVPMDAAAIGFVPPLRIDAP